MNQSLMTLTERAVAALERGVAAYCSNATPHDAGLAEFKKGYAAGYAAGLRDVRDAESDA